MDPTVSVAASEHGSRDGSESNRSLPESVISYMEFLVETGGLEMREPMAYDAANASSGELDPFRSPPPTADLDGSFAPPPTAAFNGSFSVPPNHPVDVPLSPITNSPDSSVRRNRTKKSQTKMIQILGIEAARAIVGTSK